MEIQKKIVNAINASIGPRKITQAQFQQILEENKCILKSNDSVQTEAEADQRAHADLKPSDAAIGSPTESAGRRRFGVAQSKVAATLFGGQVKALGPNHATIGPRPNQLQFEIRETLGKGGTGSVSKIVLWLDAKESQWAALKILRPPKNAKPDELQQWKTARYKEFEIQKCRSQLYRTLHRNSIVTS